MNVSTDKLIYIRDSDGTSCEPTKIIFEFETGPTIEDYKIICMRMALSLGYSADNIEEIFGKIPDENIENEFNNIFGKELN